MFRLRFSYHVLSWLSPYCIFTTLLHSFYGSTVYSCVDHSKVDFTLYPDYNSVNNEDLFEFYIMPHHKFNSESKTSRCW